MDKQIRILSTIQNRYGKTEAHVRKLSHASVHWKEICTL